MIRTQIQLTDQQMSRLRAAAEHDHVSVAEIVRRAVDEVISRRTPAVPAAELRRRALDLAGRFSSGIGDVSSSHDEHLEEAFRG